MQVNYSRSYRGKEAGLQVIDMDINAFNASIIDVLSLD